MIHISKIDDLTFTMHLHPEIASELYLFAGWGTVEDTLSRIISDTLLGANYCPDIICVLDDDVPF